MSEFYVGGQAIDPEKAENMEEIEMQFAVKAVHQAETYWSLLEKVPGSQLRLTKFDDDIFNKLLEDFPEFKEKSAAASINEDEMKSAEGKAKWRSFIESFQDIEEYNFGTLLRLRADQEYGQDTTIFAEMPPRANRPMNAQTQWKDQTSSLSPQNLNEPTYTLPGVINYLTSEFTNLERFKIMTNLEKSEMKYRILHLEGEIKTLRYANQKQQARIDSLEKENRLLKSKNKDGLSKEAPVVTNTPPEPDLESIKKSRQQLKESMKEIISLLKSPSTRLGELSISEGNQHELEEMIDNSEDDFVFGHGSNSPKSNLIAKFFDDDDKAEKKEDDKDEDVLERSITNESDVTVIESGDVEERPPEAEVKNDEISTTRAFENDGVTIELVTFKNRLTITTSMNGKIITKEVIINNSDEIQNAFALPNETFLIIGKDINLLTDGGKEKVLIPAKSSFSRIDSTAIINMTMPNDKSKTFGLAVSGFSNGTKSFLSKIYQLTAEEQIKYKEIGSFNRKFLTKNKNGSNITFVGWKYEETESAPSTPNKVVKSPPPSPSKNGNKNNTDSRLGLYNVIYRIGNQNCKVNLSLKQVVVID